jgi:hypothetical protein
VGEKQSKEKQAEEKTEEKAEEKQVGSWLGTGGERTGAGCRNLAGSKKQNGRCRQVAGRWRIA